MWNSVVSIFTSLCSYHHYIISDYFHHLKTHTVTLLSLLHLSLEPRIYFIWIFLFWTPHVNGIMQYVAFHVGFFTSRNAFRRHSCHSMGQYFINFYGWVIFHSMDMPLLFIHSLVVGHLATVNNSVVDISEQVYVWSQLFLISSPPGSFPLVSRFQ